MKDAYFGCYLAGRFDPHDGEVDEEKLAERVMAGTPLRDVCMEAAKAAISKEMTSAVKVQWIKDNLDEIKEMGADTEKAYRLYVLGRTDQLAHALEDDILAVIEEEMDEDEDDGEPTPNDGEDGDEEDDDADSDDANDD